MAKWKYSFGLPVKNYLTSQALTKPHKLKLCSFAGRELEVPVAKFEIKRDENFMTIS